MLYLFLIGALVATIGAFTFIPETVVPYISLASFTVLSIAYILLNVSMYNILITLFVIMCFFMLLIIMIQQSKGSMGLGTMGGSAQMLFGGSGGQDLFQKITWVCGILFMLGSLVLTLAKSHEMKKFSYTASKIQKTAPTSPFNTQQEDSPSTADSLPAQEAEL